LVALVVTLSWVKFSPFGCTILKTIGTQCFPLLGAQRCNTALTLSQQNLRKLTPRDKQPFSHLLTFSTG